MFFFFGGGTMCPAVKVQTFKLPIFGLNYCLPGGLESMGSSVDGLNGCGRIGLKTGGDAVMGTTSVQERYT